MPVELTCPTSDPPVHMSATMIEYDGEACIIRTPEPVLLPLGARAVLTSDREGIRILGKVMDTDGFEVRLDVIRVVRKDKRDYPRMNGGIDMRYRVVGPNESTRAEQAWLRGFEDVSSDHVWHRPHPFMNFSGSGIRFRDDVPCAADDTLLLEMTVPTGDEKYRATARVVRVFPHISGEGYAIAVQFRRLPKDAIDALRQFTLDLQIAQMTPGD